MCKVVKTHFQVLLKIVQQEKQPGKVSICILHGRSDPCAISNTLYCCVTISTALSSSFSPYELLIALQNPFLSSSQRLCHHHLGISICFSFLVGLAVLSPAFFLLLPKRLAPACGGVGLGWTQIRCALLESQHYRFAPCLAAICLYYFRAYTLDFIPVCDV